MSDSKIVAFVCGAICFILSLYCDIVATKGRYFVSIYAPLIRNPAVMLEPLGLLLIMPLFKTAALLIGNKLLYRSFLVLMPVAAVGECAYLLVSCTAPLLIVECVFFVSSISTICYLFWV